MKIPIPKHIKGDLRRVWKRLAPIVGERLTPVTEYGFQFLCETFTDYVVADALVRSLNGELTVRNPNGTFSVHPAEKIRHARGVELREQFKQWGLTPAALARLGGPVTDDSAESRAFESL